MEPSGNVCCFSIRATTPSGLPSAMRLKVSPGRKKNVHSAWPRERETTGAGDSDAAGGGGRGDLGRRCLGYRPWSFAPTGYEGDEGDRHQQPEKGAAQDLEAEHGGGGHDAQQKDARTGPVFRPIDCANLESHVLRCVTKSRHPT